MGTQKPRLLFYYLHLLGVGHVYRARRLIEAFAAEGLAVDVVYGGVPLEGVSFAAESVHYLPPVRAADATYKKMLTGNFEELSADYMENRKKALLRAFDGLEPNAIITEAFPFGRRFVRNEIDALFKAAAKRPNPPLIVSSVRDILQGNRKPGRREEMRDWIRDRFDHVMVHADPDVISLGETFPLVSDIEEKLTYTGFVVPPAQDKTIIEQHDVIVSSGGGMFGGELMAIALQLANSDLSRSWCLSTGPNLSRASASTLRDNAASHVTIVEYLDGLAEHMKHAKISISQCGYNTSMDALAAHEASDCRAVFVPHDTTGQTEQLRRAVLLQKAGYGICVPQSQLTPETLRDAFQQAQQLPKVSRVIDFNGAANSARLLRQWIESRGESTGMIP